MTRSERTTGRKRGKNLTRSVSPVIRKGGGNFNNTSKNPILSQTQEGSSDPCNRELESGSTANPSEASSSSTVGEKGGGNFKEKGGLRIGDTKNTFQQKGFGAGPWQRETGTHGEARCTKIVLQENVKAGGVREGGGGAENIDDERRHQVRRQPAGIARGEERRREQFSLRKLVERGKCPKKKKELSRSQEHGGTKNGL